MLNLKPDRLNGEPILRPVGEDGSVGEGIVFPPALKVGPVRPVSGEALVEAALADLVTVSDQHGDPLVKAQALMFRRRLAQHQAIWLKRAADNERAIIRHWLASRGFKEASEAI